MAELHHCPLGSVSCSQVHSVVAGHFSTKPVSTKGCWCWKSLSKSSKEKLLKSTWTQNFLSKSFKDVSSSEMTSFSPPTWAMWTTSWSEMIWIPIWSQQDQSHVSCCTVETSKKHRPLGLSSDADSHLQRQITKKFSGCTSIHHRCPLVLLVSCFFVDLSSSSKSNHFLILSMCRGTILYYTCDQGQLKHWSQKLRTSIYKNSLTDLPLKTARALSNQPVISNSSPRASRPATCAFVHGAASWWRKCWLWPCPAGWNHCKTYFFICSHGCHAVSFAELPNASAKTTSSTTLAPPCIATIGAARGSL